MLCELLVKATMIWKIAQPEKIKLGERLLSMQEFAIIALDLDTFD
jgi:hypothetical protein